MEERFRHCVDSLNNFCYISGLYTTKAQKKSLIDLVLLPIFWIQGRKSREILRSKCIQQIV